jgi:hypothetical protein
LELLVSSARSGPMIVSLRSAATAYRGAAGVPDRKAVRRALNVAFAVQKRPPSRAWRR